MASGGGAPSAAPAAAEVAEGEPAPGRNIKVLRLKGGPGDSAEACEALRARVKALELELEMARLPAAADGADGAAAAAAAQLRLQTSAEVGKLKAELASMTTAKERLQTVFTAKIKEFKEAVTALTGYTVSMNSSETKRYRVHSKYAHRDDVLLFAATDDGAYSLLASEYATRLDPQVRMYMQQRKSIPAFLAAVTLLALDDASGDETKQIAIEALHAAANQ